MITEEELKSARDAGKDCALNGPNINNCHYSHFSHPEKTKAWEAGKYSGELQKNSKEKA